jgi:serine/threonine-protein kinase
MGTKGQEMADEQNDARAHRPRRVGGRYEIRGRLGTGGAAEVYAAFDHRLNRTVALKLLRADRADPNALARFRHEAMLAAGLTHPNIVAVYDAGEIDGEPFIVMELVDGESLATRLKRGDTFAPPAIVDITAQLLAALDVAHAAGLVHRDVKPGNVLLTDDGTVKLADFGIAKAEAAASALTQTGHVIGTPRYLAPEQTRGEPATARSDIYATGLVLDELQAASEPPKDPSIGRVVERATAQDPAQRYPSAAAMAAALRADPTIDDAAPAATAVLAAPRRAPRTRPSRPRRGALVAIATVLLLALGIGLLAAGLGGSGDPRPSAAAGTEPTTASSPTTAVAVTIPPATAPATTPTTTAARPQSVGELLALLTNDPDGYGRRGRELFERLARLQQDPKHASRDAEKLLDELDKWVERGEISPTVAAIAAGILTPMVESDPPDGPGGPGGPHRRDWYDGEDD